MDNEKIYLVEWRTMGDEFASREIITATSIPQLFDYYIGMTNMVYFAFEDVTDQTVEEIERKMLYRAKYL